MDRDRDNLSPKLPHFAFDSWRFKAGRGLDQGIGLGLVYKTCILHIICPSKQDEQEQFHVSGLCPTELFNWILEHIFIGSDFIHIKYISKIIAKSQISIDFDKKWDTQWAFCLTDDISKSVNVTLTILLCQMNFFHREELSHALYHESVSRQILFKGRIVSQNRKFLL
mgnify:CR=1 FL=1